jgi:hypothetical protein
MLGRITPFRSGKHELDTISTLADGQPNTHPKLSVLPIKLGNNKTLHSHQWSDLDWLITLVRLA